jgi:ankyrin repeat protein
LEPLEELTAAIKANHASLVRDVLARNESLKVTINEPLPNYSFDTPPILAAVQKENREMVDALLDAGANINERSRWWAGSFGVLDSASPKLAEYLISRGATVDIHAASRLGMIDRVRQFLAADPALVHARGGDGQFPLHFAANTEIAAVLLDHGAEIDARDIDHESTAAQYMVCIGQATESGWSYRHDVARYLISRGGQTDILMASAVGDLPVVEKILDHDPDTVRITVSERSFPKRDPKSGGCIYFFGFGFTKSPHMIAHQFGHSAVFDLLMQRSAPWLRLLQAAELGDEALTLQISKEHPSLIARVTPNAARRIVGSALRNNTRAVELLLERGWPANAALDNNQTALHYAAWHGNIAMVRCLLSRNAPVNVFETEHGGSPLSWAIHASLNHWQREKGDYGAVVEALLAAGATRPVPEGPLQASEEVLKILRPQS